MEETFASLIHLKFSWKTWSNSYEFLNRRAAVEKYIISIARLLHEKKKNYVNETLCTCQFNYTFRMGQFHVNSQIIYTFYYLSVYIQQTFKNSSNIMQDFFTALFSSLADHVKILLTSFWGAFKISPHKVWCN